MFLSHRFAQPALPKVIRTCARIVIAFLAVRNSEVLLPKFLRLDTSSTAQGGGGSFRVGNL